MSLEELDINRTMEERRKAVEANIEEIDVENLKALGDRLFPFHDHPWREPFFNFLQENANTKFYHARMNDGFEIVYCPKKEKGIWYKPESGMGPLQAAGLGILKEIIDKR